MSNSLGLDRDPLIATLVDQLPVGVLVADREGNVELANDITRDLVARRPVAPIDWIIARVLLTGEMVRNEEVMFLDEHDEWRTLSVCATPVREAPDVITHALVTFLDVTERNRGRDWEPVIRALSRL